MAVKHGHARARGADDGGSLHFESGAIGIQPGQNFLCFHLELFLLAGNIRDHVVDHVHGGDAWVAGSGKGLESHHGRLRDGAETGLKGGERNHEPYHGAIRVADKKSFFAEGVELALVGNEREVGQVDGGDNQGNVWVAPVVFGIGEDCDIGFLEGGFCYEGLFWWGSVLSIMEPQVLSEKKKENKKKALIVFHIEIVSHVLPTGSTAAHH